MTKLKIGVVGLGSIAQKAYLPILTKADRFEFIGAFTPNEEKRKRLCDEHRIKPFDSIKTLAAACDAVFVHSSTKSHYDVISELLDCGVHVYVDKPLATTVAEGEKLILKSEQLNLKLMVGFNRRFAPMYQKIKAESGEILGINICKHALNSIRPVPFYETMIDDYIHAIDTALWLAGDKVELVHNHIVKNEQDHLVYTSHVLKTPSFLVTTSMNRSAGTKLEQVEILSHEKIQRVKHLNTLEVEENGLLSCSQSGAWVNILKQKGFEDCIYHFIECVENDLTPITSGEEALRAQRFLEQLFN